MANSPIHCNEWWPVGLSLIAVGYGHITVEKADEDSPATSPVSIHVPIRTKAIYVGVTGAKIPDNIQAKDLPTITGILFNIVKSWTQEGDVVAADGKVTFDAYALIRHQTPPGLWKLTLALEVLCFA